MRTRTLFCLGTLACLGLLTVGVGCEDDDDPLNSGRTGTPCDRDAAYADTTYGFMGPTGGNGCAAGFRCYAEVGQARGACGPAAHCGLPPGPYPNGYYEGDSRYLNECTRDTKCIARALPPVGRNYYGECLPPAFQTDAGVDAAPDASPSPPDTVDCKAPAPDTFRHTAGRDVDYLVTCDLAIDKSTTIEPGTVFAFKAGARISVSGQGKLVATGTADKPILMRPADTGGGVKWGGVHFFTKANQLTHVRLSHAGATRVDGVEGAVVAGVGGFGGGEVSIRDCVIDNSGSVGLSVGEGGDVPVVERLTIGSSAREPIAIQPEALGHLGGPGLKLTGNARDFVRVLGVNTSSLKGTAVTWAKLDVPYLIPDSVAVTGAQTFAPGMTLVMGKDATLHVGGAGAFVKSEGTAAEPVVIRGETPGVGSWAAITLASKGNTFAHTRISGGGSLPNAFGQRASIILDGNAGGSDVSIRDCVLEGSAGYAVHGGGQTVSLGAGNVFQGNVSGDVAP